MQDLTIKQKLTNYYYFILFNTLLANIIAIGYCFNENINNLYFFIEIKHKNLAYVFYVFNHLWRISLISLIVGLISIPSIFLPNRIRYITQAIIVCIGIGLLVYDIRMFYLCDVHITEIYPLNMLEGVFFTIGRLVYILCLFCLLLMEIYIVFLFDKSKLFTNTRILPVFSMLLLTSIIVAPSIFYFSFTNHEQKLITANRYWPLFFNKNEYLLLTNKDKQNFYFSKKTSLDELNYPINNLATTTVTPPNIVIIGIDAWREDYFNAIDTPNLWEFSQQGCIFYNHKSGANHTKFGLFSLFYALPGTYYYNFLKQQQSPVFIDRLQQLDYKLGVFIAKDYKSNDFNKTIFNKIPEACFIPSGETPAEWDNSITNAWLNWYDNRNIIKPHFSFLFYYSAHENDFPQEYSNKYMRTKGKIKHKDFVKMVGKEGLIGSYKTSIHYIDSLVAKVIQKLTNTNDLTNTIIIITSDHGRGLDDNQKKCFINGNNFTDSQIKVPCVFIGSKLNYLQPYYKQQLTTHYDIIPTIMKNFLGVKNNITDYSVGVDLLDKNHIERKWSFAASALKHAMPCAIVDDETILQWFSSGFYQFFNKQNNHVFLETINKQRLTEALDMMTRFLK